MDVGPPITSVPDVVTIEVDTGGGSSKNDFKITSSHEDLTIPTLYNTPENFSSQENIISEQNQYIDD